jgi:hypothetical protein
VNLQRFAEGLWLADGGTVPYFAPPLPVRFSYALRTVVVRLRDGSLLIDSPTRLRDDLRSATDALGPVAHLVTPNKLHHLFVADWMRAYPHAKFHAPPGLAAKRPDLRFDSTLGDRPPPFWADDLDQLLFSGSIYMDEIVFFHRSTRTLLLGDLVENHEPGVLSPIQRFWARRNAMLAPDGSTPRNFRATFLRRDRARACLRRMLAWEPERVIVLHGRCVPSGGTEFLEGAFRWLTT